jgi:predicted AlkP superfamily pyrophosphatase or phosphodiesterase
MAATSDTRTILIATLADPADFKAIETGPYAGIVPVAGHEAALATALATPHDHVTCWAKAKIPARLHYGSNPRVPPYVCLAETGWLIVKTAPTRSFAEGAHGYDNDAPEMRALFIANGPAFTPGRTLATFDNVDVAPLLRDLIGLPAGRGLDGDDAPFRAVMKR